ncbi:hypothetical protein F511_02020 [Dorcoceras hygrometricum]|uniref:Uncharacterized protein n=1 Tax=Dorcoceras hygrometricum TaxID=472368 RepID=A0A2Z7A2N7_9LAMI|nr:hypothetical protein F511_02020 [Dorcoceras hygrometricum]
MVVDLIGIYGLKGPYCTLTTTDWFLQALSVIPRGSWGDVARRFTMIRWAVQADWREIKSGRGPDWRNYRNLPRRVGFLKHRLEPGTSASEPGGGSGSPTVVSEPGFPDLINMICLIVSNCISDRLKRTEIFGESHGSAAHGGAPPRALRASDRAPDELRSAKAATSFAQGSHGDAPLIARHWSHDAGRSLACRLCARRAEAMRRSTARNATPCNLLRCWMRDTTGLLLRITVRRCAAPAPPAARRLCDAGSLMCARPCARVRSCGVLDFVAAAAAPAMS